jgi:uncharacterized Rmd1/YagE family protein
MTTLFAGVSTMRARALCISERIDVRALESTTRLSPSAPLCFSAGAGGAAVVFRYGVVVFVNVAPLEEATLLSQLQAFLGEPFAKPETEELEIRIAADDAATATPVGEMVHSSALVVPGLTVERVQVIAEILARSVALARYEAAVRDSAAAVESWAQALQSGRDAGAFQKQLFKNLGSTILIQSSMTSRVEIGDKPELLWERPDLERLYLRLEDEFELQERDKTLERKLALLSSTAEMLINLVDNKHAHRLEYYIIGLIVVETLIALYTVIAGVGH